MSKYEEPPVEWIGKGSFGDVETVIRSWDQKTVIRKTVRFDPEDVKASRNAKNESRSQRYLDHPNIARYIDVEWRDNQVRYYMDYFKKGSLNTLIGKAKAHPDNKVPQEQLWAIMYQLSAAVAYCHDPEKELRDVEDDESEGPGMKPAQVLHRDIKPHNVLRASKSEDYLEELKLCDFGMSFILEGSNKPQTYAGTREYRPPEISWANEGGIEWTTKCDIYSLGCTLYEICNGKPPFPNGSPDSESEAKKATIHSYYDDSDLRSWIQRCLSFHASQRPEAQEIRDAARDKLKDIPKYERALGHQSLLKAVEKGSVEKVEEELSHLEMTDLQDGRFPTPLHRAVEYRRVDVVKRLLERGFSALARTENDETPVHLAIELTMKSKDKKLKFKRKLSDIKDETSESKENLRSLSRILELDKEISELLVKSCDISKLRDEIYRQQDWTLLHLAAAANNVYLVEYVLENSGWRDSSKGPQWSLIHIAARMGHLDLLTFLIGREKGRQEAVVEQKSSDEATPLFAASKRGQADAVRLLLKKGANINVLASNIKIRAQESRCDVTALHIAALGGHTEVVKILRDDKRIKVIEAKTNQGETALHLAVQNNHQSCQGVIDALGKIINIEERAITKKRTALHVAVENGNVKGTLKLLGLGAKPNVENEDRDTALHLAARKGLKAIAEALLNKGAQAGKRNRAGATPLHAAIENSMHEDDQGKKILDKAVTETAEMLIEKDEKLVSHEARYGNIALHLAAKVGNFKVFKAAYGRNPALVNAQKTNKETALHVAAHADRHKIVEFLLHNNANWNLKNEDGRRALEVATGRSEAILEKWG